MRRGFLIMGLLCTPVEGEGGGGGGAPVTPTAPTPPVAPVVAPADDLAVRFKALEQERNTLAETLRTRDAAIAERDTQLLTVTGERDKYKRGAAEAAIVSAVRAKLPHANDTEVRAAIVVFAEAGEVDRYSDKPAEAAAKVLALIPDRMPALARVPAQGGGPNGGPPLTSPNSKPPASHVG